MKSYEYSGEETAEFIGKELMRTLNLSKEEVASKYIHMVYDGVYATNEERVKGGGSLDLKRHFAEWCNQDQENISSSWDLGHIMQLIYSDTLKKNTDIKKFTEDIFRLMGKHKKYQAGLVFNEKAYELEHPTLTNKASQETRWVRSLLRAIETYLRNLPTYVAINSSEMVMCCRQKDVTGQKEVLKVIDELTNPSTISLAIGLCQILEEYSRVSLDGQNLQTSPSRIPLVVENLEIILRKWSETWTWAEKELKLAGIGEPKSQIENLKKGFYQPHITKGVKISAANKINSQRSHDRKVQAILKELGDENEISDIKDNISAEDVKIEKIPIIDCTDELLQKTENKLTKVCKELLKNLELRLDIPSYLTHGRKAFVETKWFDLRQDENEAKQIISDLLDSLPQGINKLDEFKRNIVKIDYGYLTYLKFSHKESLDKARNDKINSEFIYEKYCKTNTQSEDLAFQQLYEYVNIRTYSEAICETIGSMMAISLSNGRNLSPFNLEKEICLKFNLPPLHILNETFVPEIAKEWREKGGKKKEFF